MVEPTTLTSPMVRAPRRLASRMAASVSAVSPDWEMPMTSVLRVHHRVAVAELGGVLDLDREPGHLFQHVLADDPGVPGGAAGGDDDPLELLQLLVAQVEAADAGGPFLLQQVAAERVAQALRLLADLLQHEVGVAAPLHLARSQSIWLTGLLIRAVSRLRTR